MGHTTIEVLTNVGKREYTIDNTGESDVSDAVQAMLDETASIVDASATITFSPGVYFVDAPLTVRLASVRLQGHAHGGLDIHGANLSGGSILRFGPNCGPNCITFAYTGRSKAFPSGESPWPRKIVRVDVDKLTFMGHNNTDVDTASGYSRFREDEPNFRGLKWYPALGRYTDVEAEGQRALVIPPAEADCKSELLRVNGCHFTDLYVGLDIAGSDVSHITDSWFAQMVDGIRFHGKGQATFISNTLFADLETGLSLAYPTMSSIHDNTFAYVSKCFEIGQMEGSSIRGNTLLNWDLSTGAAAQGSFIHIGGPSKDIVVSENSLQHEIDSRAKTRTVDEKPNGHTFMQFESCERLHLSNNVIDTVQTETVVRLHDCKDCVVVDNVITHGFGGSAVAETGDCSGNFYRKIKFEDSDSFDGYVA
jgi:hypothetical protein